MLVRALPVLAVRLEPLWRLRTLRFRRMIWYRDRAPQVSLRASIGPRVWLGDFKQQRSKNHHRTARRLKSSRAYSANTAICTGLLPMALKSLLIVEPPLIVRFMPPIKI